MKKAITLIIICVTAIASVNAMALNDNIQAYQDFDHHSLISIRSHQAYTAKPALAKFDNLN